MTSEDFFKKLSRFGKAVEEVIAPKPVVGDDKPILLDEAKLRETRWMTARQIEAIYSGRKVKIVDTPGAMRELRWMSENQLNALFGRKVSSEDE